MSARVSTRRFALLTAVTVLAGAVVAAAWLRATAGAGALGVLGRADPRFAALLVALTGGFVVVRFVRWQFLLRRASVSVPTRGSLHVYLASLPGTATPAYLGEVIRCVFLRRRFQAPLRRTLLCLLVERLLDLGVLALIAAVLADKAWLRATLAASVVLAWLVLRGSLRVAARAGAPALLELASARSLGGAFLLSCVLWLPVAAGLALAAAALGLELGPLAAMHSYATGTLFGALTLMPAGFGTSGSAQIVLLQEHGLELAGAVSTVTLFRGLTTGVCLLAGSAFLLLELRQQRRAGGPAAHFDEIAADYGNQFKPHVWELLLRRRTGMIAASLPQSQGAIGLDLGCGLGLQARALRGRGLRVVGIDPAVELLRVGRPQQVPTAAASALRLPFADQSLDFVYSVGVLHHLIEQGAQDQACREVARVLKPGGVFVVQETNTRNPLFRFYMGYVFPILSRIDEGTERWIEPFAWQRVPDLELDHVRYFTFLPDFIPQKLMPPFLALERRLEASRLAGYSVHYQAVLRKPAGPAR